MIDDQEKAKAAKLSKKLLNTINKLLEAKGWDSSLLLRTTKKRLDTLKSETETLLNDLTGGIAQEAEDMILTKLPSGYIKVYIFLYQAEGRSLKIWYNVLKSLPKYGVTRPVYRDEKHVQELVRSKADIQKYAYATIAIKEEDILPKEKPNFDPLKHELISLREGSIKLENILSFVHANKHTYVLRNNELKLVD